MSASRHEHVVARAEPPNSPAERSDDTMQLPSWAIKNKDIKNYTSTDRISCEDINNAQGV